ncbi:MAG: hypothetical protein JXB23_15810 [Candidatus Aminicenantes bacterium]|nr:hypothetical protein [Candidatus Aminicenantes bacterium]
MNSVFWLQLGLGFIAGSFAVSLTTVAAEKFGSNVGGLIGGIPSTSVVALLFIGIVQSPEYVIQATNVMPLVMGFNGLFLVIFVILSRYGFLAGLGGAFAMWFGLSYTTISLGFRHFGIGMALFFLSFIFSYFVMEKKLHLPAVAGVRVRFTPLQIAARSLFSGLVIAVVIFLSKVSGPLIGGVFAVFPAVFTSTIVISSLSRGVAFARALTKPLLVSAMINVIVYIIAVRYLYPELGLVLGTIGALAASSLSVLGSYSFIKKKMA